MTTCKRRYDGLSSLSGSTDGNRLDRSGQWRKRGGWLAAGFWLLLAAFPSAALGLTQAELDAHRDRWDANGSDDYNVFIQRSCFCDPESESIRPGLVEVRSGNVVAVTDAETLEPLDPHNFLTVEGLFGELQNALDLPAYMVQAEFHEALGYPTSIGIDMFEDIGDDWTFYEVRDLSLIPEPTSLMLAILSAVGCVAVMVRGGAVHERRTAGAGSSHATFTTPSTIRGSAGSRCFAGFAFSIGRGLLDR